MQKTPLSIFIYTTFVVVIFALFYLFYPRRYDVSTYQKSSNTQYWNLSSGSKIGYRHLQANEETQPYPVIYLHGGPGGCIHEDIIHSLVPLTEVGYEVYAYDQIGSGSSARLVDIEQYSVNRHVSDLEEIVKKIGAEKVILIGQSWGSVLANFFIVDHPNMVDKLIMTGPGPIFPINDKLSQLKAPDSLDLKEPHYTNEQGNNEVYTFRDKCVKWYAYNFGGKLISDEQVDGFFTHLSNKLNRSCVYDTTVLKKSTGGGGYYAHIMTMKSLYNEENPREKMKNIHIPVLIMKGEYDNQKWGFTQEYLQLFDHAKLKVIPLAGHFIHLEQGELYSKEMIDFLGRDDIP